MYKKPLVIVPREEWTDPPAPVPPLQLLDKNTLVHPAEAVILSYTGTPVCLTNEECKAAMRQLHDKYKAKGLYEMPYNFVVGGDGTVYEARGWHRIPEVNQQFPQFFDKSIEIGHFGEKGKLPDPTQIQGSWVLTLYGIHHNYIDPDVDRYQQFLEPVVVPQKPDIYPTQVKLRPEDSTYHSEDNTSHAEKTTYLSGDNTSDAEDSTYHSEDNVSHAEKTTYLSEDNTSDAEDSTYHSEDNASNVEGSSYHSEDNASNVEGSSYHSEDYESYAEEST